MVLITYHVHIPYRTSDINMNGGTERFSSAAPSPALSCRNSPFHEKSINEHPGVKVTALQIDLMKRRKEGQISVRVILSPCGVIIGFFTLSSDLLLRAHKSEGANETDH